MVVGPFPCSRPIRRIWDASWSLTLSLASGTRERVIGYQQALRAAGLTWRDIPMVEAGGFDEPATERAVNLLLDNCPGLTAILASTDVLALQTLRELRARAIRVPDDTSVIGFDDVPDAAAAGLRH